MADVPVVLTIAGSDNSAGAGIQADLKTFTALHVYGLTAVTCIVAEVPGRVAKIQAADLAVVRAQIALSLETFPVAAIKTGLLHSAAVVELVVELCTGASPLIVDPVMVASSGDHLLEPATVRAYAEKLLPRATLVTPNIDEARVLLGSGVPITDLAGLHAAGSELVRRFGVAFLMKGGHLLGDEARDVLFLPGGVTHGYAAPFTENISTHGTGCTYAAAIAAYTARGFSLPDAVAAAKTFVTATIAQSLRWVRDSRRVEALTPWPLLK